MLMKKRIIYLGVFAALLVSALGVTTFAASSATDRQLYGSTTGKYAYAKITNNASTKRYCYVTIYHGSYSDGSYKAMLDTKSGGVAKNKSLSASGYSSKTYFWAKGAKYNSASSQSGIAASYSISFRK